MIDLEICMAGPTISFSTYTYNDAEFAADLIRQAQVFTVQPDEYIVVDDGSDTVFSMDNPPENLRIIRFDTNQGITRAKGAGLSAATGDFIFSMDCDTRVNPNWLEQSLPHANVPEIGLTGGALVYNSGDDLVSRYLAKFGDNHNQHHIGSVGFIPGNAFLLRRSTWEEAGGFTAYNETNCQDHYLCHRLKSLGYTLYSDARAKAWQLRRITRTTMCKRVWKWCHKPIKLQAETADDIPNYLFGILAAPMLERCNDAGKMGEPLFYYLELLYLAHSVLDTLDHLTQRGLMTDAARNGFPAALGEFFRGFPKIWAMLRADLLAMGHTMFIGIEVENLELWSEFLIFGQVFREGGLLGWLDQQGVPLLIRDELDEGYHFSSYAQASFAV